MATAEERTALLGVSCDWCGAAPREECGVRDPATDRHKGTRRYAPRPVTTLDGGCHDARWRKALGRAAPVLTAAVPAPDPVRPGDGNLAPASGTSTAVLDRPW